MQSDHYIPGIPGLPPLPTTPEEWPEWKERILEHRVRTRYEAERSPEIMAREIARSDKSFLYMLTTYGNIYEARDEDEYTDDEYQEQEEYETEWNIDSPEGGIIPFIPYPFQVETAYWIDGRMRVRGGRGDGVIIKARDMGLSNLAAAWTAHKWLFRDPFQARLLSRREDLVDRTGDPDSLFWKIEMFLMALPDWLFYAGAPGFDWKQHRLMMRFINPSNGNFISGESTQVNAGRGGRSTIIIYDEAAFMPNFGEIWSAGRASTNHRLAISTVSTQQGMDFYNLVHGEDGYISPPTLAIEWSEHPEHGNEWFELERERDHPDKFAREVLMDWHAGASNWVYPETHSKEPGPYPFVPYGGDFIIAMDDGSRDDFAIVFMQYIRETGRIRVLDSYTNSGQPADFYGELLTGQLSNRFRWGQREINLANWLKNMPPATYYGDAHGKQIEQIANESLWGYLWSKYGIVVNYYINSESGTRLTFETRRMQMGKILPMFDFNNNVGGIDALTAFKRYRYKPRDEDKGEQTEPKEPLHDKYSHLVSAVEYFAVQFSAFRLISGRGGRKIQYTGKRNAVSPGNTLTREALVESLGFDPVHLNAVYRSK